VIAPMPSVPPTSPWSPAVSPQIHSLANLVKSKATRGGKKFVLLLGAGASLSSGVAPTWRLMQQLVDQYGADIPAGPLERRFDALWRRSPSDHRRMFLEPYLNCQPSAGYEKLALLIQQGFFDLAVTFNYDNLVEAALKNIGFTDYRVVIRGDTDVDQIARLVEEPVAGFTLLKLHGSLASTDTFLFDQGEMFVYPPAIGALFERLTKRDLIVCGYAFKDLCVMRAFAPEGGAVVCVNPDGAPDPIRSVLINRNSLEWAIRDEDGTFDNFAGALAAALLAPAQPPAKAARPASNPFKFLAAYEAGDASWFVGRKRLRQQFLSHLTQDNRTVLHVFGPPRSGKTSFVRAGVMPRLDGAGFEPLYLRCRPDLEKLLIDLAASRRPQETAPPALPAALAALAGTAAKPVVLFLDQFERLERGVQDSDAGWDPLLALFNALCACAAPELRLVFVTSEEKHFMLVLQSDLPADLRAIDRRDWVKPLTAPMISTMLRFMIKKSGLSFDPRIVAALLGELSSRREGTHPFTLAHLQAICYLLVGTSCTTWEKYQAQTSRLELERALDLAITECDIMNFLEDFPTRSERRLVRSFMQVVPEPSKRLIARFIKERFGDLLRDVAFPEPLA
jgi:hypothetical protein